MKEKQFCRCCLSTTACKNISDVYINDKIRVTYAEMLLNTFNITLQPTFDTYLICDSCTRKLINAFIFKVHIHKTQGTLSKAWDILKRNIDDKLKLEDMDNVSDKVEYLNEDNVQYVENTKEKAPITVVKLRSEQNNKKEIALDNNEIVRNLANNSNETSIAQNFTIKIRDNCDNKDHKKTLKSTERVKKSNNKNITTKKNDAAPVHENYNKVNLKHGSQRITQPELNGRQNTLKLIENSNMCLFRSLKTKFGCFICKASFVDAKELRKHWNKHADTTLAHRVSKWSGVSFKNVDITDLKCNQCFQKIDNLNQLTAHLKDNHNLPVYGDNSFLIPYKLDGENQCALCELKFKTFLRLSIHMNTHYRNNVCEICGLSFINRISLRMHRQSQHKEKRCTYCSAIFLTLSSKVKHMRQIHKLFKARRYCNLCDKTFLYTYLLDKHKIKEHGAKQIAVNCNECEKTFFNEANLRVHKRSVHIKERNYPCEVCGSRFFTKCDQKRHEKTHNDERSFLCSYCETKFKSKDSWRRHMKRQHGHTFT